MARQLDGVSPQLDMQIVAGYLAIDNVEESPQSEDVREVQ
jgi:hypothetical protein